MNIPEKLRRIEPYEPVDYTFPVKLDANERPFNLSEEMRRRIADAAFCLDYNRYPDPNCTALRAAAARAFGIPAENLMAGNGSDELISLVMTCFAGPNSRVLVTDPDFSMYSFYANLTEANVRRVLKGGDFLLTADKVIAAMEEERPDIVIFSNPCNPTGLGIEKSEVLHVLRAADCLVVVDEAYMDFWSESVLPDALEFDHVIVLKTLSKAYGLAAIRLGFMAANGRLTAELNKARSPYNVGALTQEIGTLVLSDPDALKEYRKMLSYCVEDLKAVISRVMERYPGVFDAVPGCTNFAVLRAARAKEIHEKLLARGISVRLFSNGLMRITAGTPEENERLELALNEILKGDAV